MGGLWELIYCVFIADFCAAFNSGVQFAFLDRASASNTGSAEIVSTTPVGKAIGRHLAWGDRMRSVWHL